MGVREFVWDYFLAWSSDFWSLTRGFRFQETLCSKRSKTLRRSQTTARGRFISIPYGLFIYTTACYNVTDNPMQPQSQQPNHLHDNWANLLRKEGRKALETTRKETLCWGFLPDYWENMKHITRKCMLLRYARRMCFHIIWVRANQKHACVTSCNVNYKCHSFGNSAAFFLNFKLLKLKIMIMLGDSLPNDSIFSACCGHTVVIEQYYNTTDC